MARHFTWFLLAASLMIVCVGQTPVSAATPATNPAVAQKVDNAAAPATQQSASQMVKERRAAFLQNNQLEMGSGNRGNAYVGWGQMEVSVGTNDSKFPLARFLAFRRASLQAEADYIKAEQIQIYGHLVQDNTSNGPAQSAQKAIDDAPGKDMATAITDKLLLLADAEINKRLRELGVDASDLMAKEKAEKTSLMSKRISEKVEQKAIGSLAGVRTLQTFEGYDDEKNYQVGVLVIHSPQSEQLAALLRDGRAEPNGDVDHGNEIKARIPSDPTLLVAQFGVRVLYDSDNNPWIVSFGQAAPGSQATNNVEQGEDMAEAEQLAADLALHEISLFGNSTLAWSRQSEVAQDIQKYRLNYPSGKTLDNLVTDFLQSSHERFEVEDRLKVAGVQKVRTWEGKHPISGQRIYGAVLLWSPFTQRVAQQFHDDPRPTEGTEPAKTPKSGSFEGVNLEDPKKL